MSPPIQAKQQCFICQEPYYPTSSACRHFSADLLKVGNNLVVQIDQMKIEMDAAIMQAADQASKRELAVRRNGKLRLALEQAEQADQTRITQMVCTHCRQTTGHAVTCMYSVLEEKV